MGLHFLFSCNFLLLVLINFIVRDCFFELVIATDLKYQACKPRTCGKGPDIGYPFFIRNNSTDYCGYPGFGIHCEKDVPTYRTSRSQYMIESISYENQSFRLLNLEVINNSNCPTPRLNYSFDRSSVDFSAYHADLLFFYNCNDSSLINYTISEVSCSSKPKNKTFIALLHGDEISNQTEIELGCEYFVAAPVQLEQEQINQTVKDVDYIKLLRDGFSLKWMKFGFDCFECRASGGNCGFEKENDTSVCYCPDGSHPKHCHNYGNDIGQKIGLGVGVPVAIIILLSLYTFRRYYKKKKSDFDLSKSQSDPSSQAELEEGSIYYGVPVFSYSELEEATNNFDTEKELGDGGFGTVYYGKLRDGREVAVKRLYEHNYRRLEQFVNEIKILTRLHHKNLVTLYGCTSRRSRELLLVYEYIPNGTVADHLHGDRANSDPLAWLLRLRIAIETAAALAYLHASDIIHRDVKTNNILLDNNFAVKVADFGISRLFPSDATHVSTAPQGTPGYVDPEYHQCYQLTDKSDVYSYGVVLIELISSMPAVDISRHRHEINLANLAVNKIQNCALDELVDQQLGYGSDEEVRRTTTSVAELAFRCLQQDKELRPTMDEVLAELKRIESGENEEAKVQQKVDGILRQQSLPPLSPPYSDEAVLLKNVRLPPSPISVAERWISSDSTIPNVSC